MMTKRGSQMREPIEETEYRVVSTWPNVERGCVVLADESGKRELWTKRDDYAGYVVVIHGRGYEFVRSL
jgi:hypothetical protein